MSSLYNETIDWLFNQVPMFQNIGINAYKPGLEGILKLSQAFGNPHNALRRAVHIAGTNGKGSVSSLLSSILQESGMKVGLYTSPHLVDFRERIRINGEKISEDAVIDFIRLYREKNLTYDPSFFELTTVMAFDWFAKNDVEIAIIEVGLGGRLDSTNIIKPELCVITNISFDHTAQLGNSLEEIATEKAGIIKRDIPVVIGNVGDSVKQVFIDKARTLSSPLFFAQDSTFFSNAVNCETHILYKDTPWGDIDSPLSGEYQIENASTVMEALSHLGRFDTDVVKRGFKKVCINTGLLGRWTILSENPRIICDTGHNPGGWVWLGHQLRTLSENSRLHIVAGFVNDKDISHIIEEMPYNAIFYWTTPSVKRGKDSFELASIAKRYGLKGNVFKNVATAFEEAKKNASPSDIIFVGGSTFVVADLLIYLQKD